MNTQEIFSNKQTGSFNKDLDAIRTRDYYLELTKDHESRFNPFHICSENGFNIIDESMSCQVGYKARAGEFLVSTLKAQGCDEIVYVQPRVGFAGISLSYLCKLYDMKLTLIMPASKVVSDHQALCIEYGAKPLFARIAAMPVANIYAKKYADEKQSRAFVKLGLYHELVIACGIRCFYDYFKDREKPRHVWSAISTGVLTRTMQIALPDTSFSAVAVARNIQHGELGSARFYSYHKPFSSRSDLIPESFDCESTYDAKAWHYMNLHGTQGDWFFNVAGHAPKPTIDKALINSYREWKDMGDFSLKQTI